MVQIYSAKTTITFKANDIVAFPVHIVLLNLTKSFHCFLIDYSNTLLALLFVSTFEISGDEDHEKGECGVVAESLEYVVPYQMI